MPLRRRIGSSASEERLERLIEDRLKPGSNREFIDGRIWDLFGEDWAVMFTDLSGFSRNVAKFGIIHFLQTIYESERILVPVLEENDGILLKTEGDSMLVIFRNPAKALHAAVEMQGACAAYNESRPDEEKVLLCVGLGYGKMLRIGDTDVFGREVNASSKLGEDVAGAGEILATDAVRQAVSGQDYVFKEIEETPAGVGGAWKLEYGNQ